MSVSQTEYDNINVLLEESTEDSLEQAFELSVELFENFFKKYKTFEDLDDNFKDNGKKIFFNLYEIYNNTVFFDVDEYLDEESCEYVKKLIVHLKILVDEFDKMQEIVISDKIRESLIFVSIYFQGSNKTSDTIEETDEDVIENIDIEDIKKSLILKKISDKCNNQVNPLTEYDENFYKESIKWLREQLMEFDKDLFIDVVENFESDDFVDYWDKAKDLYLLHEKNNDNVNKSEEEKLSKYMKIQNYTMTILSCKNKLENKDTIKI